MDSGPPGEGPAALGDHGVAHLLHGVQSPSSSPGRSRWKSRRAFAATLCWAKTSPAATAAETTIIIATSSFARKLASPAADG